MNELFIICVVGVVSSKGCLKLHQNLNYIIILSIPFIVIGVKYKVKLFNGI